MAAQKLTQDLIDEALALVAKHGNVFAASRASGIARSTLQNRVDAADRGKAEAPLSPAERRDAEFWRRRYQNTAKDLDETRHALREVAGLAARPIRPPGWILPRPGKIQNAVGLLHLSDLHVGEVVRPEEVNGYNEYSIDIFRRRLRRCVDATTELLPRWGSDCSLHGVVVAVNGDIVSGDIHDELARNNELTSLEQVMAAASEIASALLRLRDVFGTVWAIFTPGNHGRTTHKTHAKRTAALNYDSLIGKMIADRLDQQDGITVHVAPGRDAVYPVLGWSVFQSHGDAIGTNGGKGFAGPMLPIVRGSKAVEAQAMQVRQFYDIILTAHYHTSGNPGGNKLANGSMIGYSEFAYAIRASVEPPKQWLALVTERWPLRERADLMLEDPPRAEKPRIRVTAEGKR